MLAPYSHSVFSSLSPFYCRTERGPTRKSPGCSSRKLAVTIDPLRGGLGGGVFWKSSNSFDSIGREAGVNHI